MKIEKIHSQKKINAQLLLLILPACVVGGYMLWHINQYYTVLNNQWLRHTLFLSLGLITGCIFYNHRFRFIPTFLSLLLVLYIVGKVIGNVFTGEFSAFYAHTNFIMFSFLFTVGWLIGWGFARLRYFPIILSALLLVIQMIVVSKTTDITAAKLMIAFAPVLLFALYIVYAAELVRNMSEDEPSFSWFIGKRLIGFGVVSTIILLLLLLFFTQDFKAIEKQFGGAGKEQEGQQGQQQSMTKQNKDGSVSNNNQMGMGSSRKKSKQLVFIAKLDNFFPGTENPNPLYFTYDYYTKFDTLTQTFEIDSTMPSPDLFKPDPSKIPLYFTKSDSSVLVNAKGILKRKVVTTEVYKALLSPNDFLAPSTAFFCQPIAVEKDYKQQFKSAYRAKMYVSDLNSAYFVYNPAGNTQLEEFQQARFNELRQITGWPGEDKKFMDYYTFMPKGEAYDTIRMLANQITKDASTPIDKMIAIRNYFLSEDENKQPLFKYTDNPGIPGLPSANKLTYFLLENRKGYCAYFAGATLFMFRALGIPSRIATGFLTVDRSDKNKGWYWFYEDQAHAWVQVYFPGYGWIDFDTTIPSTEQQEAPAPDGTPPVNMQSAYLVAHGKLLSIDTTKKRAQMEVQKMIYHDKVFEVPEPFKMDLDLSIASVTRDSGTVSMSELKNGMEITALSFSEQFKSLPPGENDKLQDIRNKIPLPAPIDEVRILDPEKEKEKKKEVKKETHPFSLWTVVWITLGIIGGTVLLVFSLPALIYAFYKWKANRADTAKSKAYWSYMAATYLMNQLGYNRQELTPLQFAQQQVDANFGTEMATFTQVYLKTKYSSMPLLPYEEKTIRLFYPSFIKSVNSKIPFKKRFGKFLNFYRTLSFYTKPKN